MKSLIITWAGFQDQEVIYPYYRLREESGNPEDVAIMSNHAGKIFGILGVGIDSHLLTDELKDPERVRYYLDNFDLLVLPGGVKALEKLRQEKHVTNFIYQWDKKNKVIASTCHGAQLLISANIVNGRKVSGYYSIEDDVNNAGAKYVNEPVVVDKNLVTSPHYNWMGEWMHAAIERCKTS